MLSIRVQNNLLEFYKSQNLYGNISSEIKQEGSYFNPKLAAVKQHGKSMGVQIGRVAVMPESKIHTTTL